MKVTDSKVSSVGPKVSSDEPVRSVPAVERVSTAETQAVRQAIAEIQRALPADRSARVQQIAQAVKKGQYQPNPQQIAERILSQAELEARLRAILDR